MYGSPRNANYTCGSTGGHSGPVGQHVPHFPIHLAGNLAHRHLQHVGGLPRGHGDPEVDAGLVAQVNTTHRQPIAHGT